jgi:hypothetical protein
MAFGSTVPQERPEYDLSNDLHEEVAADVVTESGAIAVGVGRATVAKLAKTFPRPVSISAGGGFSAGKWTADLQTQ